MRADFIAQHIDSSFLKVQLKGRLTVAKKHEEKELWIAFPEGEHWYVYPHDAILRKLRYAKKASISPTYTETGGCNFPGLSKELRLMLEEYRIKPIA